MTKAHFARIDFYDAIQLLGIGLVDFDKTYPHVTKKIQEWHTKWEPSVCCDYVKAVDGVLKVNTPDNAYEYIIRFAIARIDLLPSIALLINLRKSKTIQSVSFILDNLMRPDEYSIIYD